MYLNALKKGKGKTVESKFSRTQLIIILLAIFVLCVTFISYLEIVDILFIQYKTPNKNMSVCLRGGPGSKKFFSRPLGPHLGRKIRGGEGRAPRAPPLDPPLTLRGRRWETKHA